MVETVKLAFLYLFLYPFQNVLIYADRFSFSRSRQLSPIPQTIVFHLHNILFFLFITFFPNLENTFQTILLRGLLMPETIIQISKISSNRQVTIPVEVMEKLKLKVGDKILWIEQDKNIIIRKT